MRYQRQIFWWEQSYTLQSYNWLEVSNLNLASLLFTIGGAVVNALAFSGTNFVFCRLTDHGTEERKRHYLVLEKLQMARDEWNKDQMKRLDFINKRLREKK